MNFKKTTNSIENLDAFIDGADTQKDTSIDKKVSVVTKISKELSNKIKLKYPKMPLTKYIEQALMVKIPHINEDILLTICQQAEWFNTSIADFVRYKMGLMEAPEPNELNKNEEKLENKILYVSNDNKKIIKRNAENIGLSLYRYSEIKIKVTYELKDIFTFEELMQFKAEAINYDLELDEYIAMRIRG
ncbi:TPA: hypothetical protein RPW15_001999 [Campylobacter fetus subsp. venerealis]|uniref:Uncharacterized protein n=3 Tax=Campylobacter TaxID=194 RepID=A0AAE6MAS1_CAMFE|nr:hypothetical protein [Campylobacter fetus]OCS21840.1 hypothetical protein CFVI97532_07745 [Campylobacter fetus subsp. venerealis cfvi97/532]OCS24877.1 hypothetical protein CFVB10_09685 [Campylobacter fetus subsp. venerealis cfvB10]OCS28060.1 hypothetical protein CFVCCUG33900_09310 [Campylobacter fetus subsp. venerealis LMG 6570 = CCUG 33900]OCS38307.1 hypothetical protein CFVI02298_09975 [Campylobacter fetus subsp. venerealis cfvi02/298]AHE94534.1 hypothetical protein CFVI03293_1230 [Campyl